ncbi:MAG: AAA domain-containing protein [Planctomycetes bacterium]|nr:AAA domain-containing protein [Planctomycetota bacterium]
MVRSNNNYRLNRPQIRVLLDYLGVPFPRQGKTAGQSLALLNSFKELEPDRYNEAVDLVVHHKLPEGSTKEQQHFYDFGKMLTEQIATIEGLAIKNLKEDASKYLNKAVEEISFEAKAALEREAKKYRRIEVKVGKNKIRKMDVTLPEVFSDIVQLAAARVNVLMKGPAGCGKTFIASQVAKALDLDFSSQSCSEGLSESALIGWLLPVSENSSFTYVQSEFVRLYENGGVFLFDELDAADPNVMIFMNQALANEGFSLPQRHKKPYAKKHKDFVAIGAANTFGTGADQMYVRNQLDAATLDRFKIGTVVMDYDDQVERAIVNEEVLSWGLKIRNIIKSHGLQRIMSTRALLDGSKMKEVGWSVDQIAKNYFSDWSEDELLLVGAGR